MIQGLLMDWQKGQLKKSAALQETAGKYSLEAGTKKICSLATSFILKMALLWNIYIMMEKITGMSMS